MRGHLSGWAESPESARCTRPSDCSAQRAILGYWNSDEAPTNPDGLEASGCSARESPQLAWSRNRAALVLAAPMPRGQRAALQIQASGRLNVPCGSQALQEGTQIAQKALVTLQSPQHRSQCLASEAHLEAAVVANLQQAPALEQTHGQGG